MFMAATVAQLFRLTSSHKCHAKEGLGTGYMPTVKAVPVISMNLGVNSLQSIDCLMPVLMLMMLLTTIVVLAIGIRMVVVPV